MEKPLVVVIIINFNGKEDTIECLSSLRLTTYQPFSVIVVDNGSNEDQLLTIGKDFLNVYCVKSDQNLGFTGGNNLGLSKALEMNPKYIFFLNNDTVVRTDTLSVLVDIMERHPDLGLVGPLTYYFNEPSVVSFCGGNIDRNTGRINFIKYEAALEESPQELIYCNFVEGAAIFIRAALIEEVGGFNDEYFLTSEESELCIKIADMGKKLAVVKKCSIKHKVSRTMGAGSALKNYFVYRNRLHFVRNNSNNFKIKEFSYILYCYIRTLASFLFKERNLPAAYGLILGVIDFVRGIKGVGHYRRQLQKSIHVGGR